MTKPDHIRIRLPERGITFEERVGKIAKLVGLVASAQFILTGVADLFPELARRFLWVGVGIVVGLTAIRIETFFLRHGQRGG